MKIGHRLWCVSVALFSAGWVVPMWLGIQTCLDFWELEVVPILVRDPRGNSFPFLDFAGDCFGWALAWLAAAIAFWAYLGYAAVLRARVAAR